MAATNFDDGPYTVVTRQLEIGNKALKEAREYRDSCERAFEAAKIEVRVVEQKLAVWEAAEQMLRPEVAVDPEPEGGPEWRPDGEG